MDIQTADTPHEFLLCEGTIVRAYPFTKDLLSTRLGKFQRQPDGGWKQISGGKTWVASGPYPDYKAAKAASRKADQRHV